MTDLAELVVRIKADATQLQQEMAKTTQTVTNSTNQMAAAFNTVKSAIGTLGIALSVGAIVDFEKSALDAANSLYIMGQRTGFAASTLSALNIPLQQNGSSVDEFSNSMKFMARNIEEASPQVIGVFNNLGLSISKLRQLTPEDQFYAIAQALGGVADQGKLTADIMALFGRNGQALIPIIRSTTGNIADMVAQIKATGGALTDDEIKKVHEYDDAWTSFWEHAKIHAVEGTLALREFMETAVPGSGVGKAPPTVNVQAELEGMIGKPASKDATGNNNDIDGTAQKAKDSAKALQDYIQNLQDETTALGLGKEQLAEYRAEKEAAKAAGVELNQLTPDTKAAIDSEADAYFQATEQARLLNEEHQKQIQMTAQLEAQVSSSMADIIVNYKNFGTTVTGVLDQIAKKILEDQITSPLVNSIGQMLGAPNTASKTGGSSGGIFSGLLSFLPHFAGGGNPPVGSPSLVGENGPELFVPNSAGTIIPNNKMGGQSVIVQQQINLSPGLSETVNAAIMNAAPSIAAMAHAGVMQAIQKGGAESRIVGKRS